MPELGATVEVEPGTPEVLAAKIGQPIEATSLLWSEPPGMEIGFILHFRDGDVGIANVVDELIVLALVRVGNHQIALDQLDAFH